MILDTFTLALTDGLNQETKVISVEIVPIDDQSPQLSLDLRPLLIVSEGDEAVITPRYRCTSFFKWMIAGRGCMHGLGFIMHRHGDLLFLEI